MKKTATKSSLKNTIMWTAMLISLPFYIIYCIVDENHKTNKKNLKLS